VRYVDLLREIKRHPGTTTAIGLGYFIVLLGLAWMSMSGCPEAVTARGACIAWLAENPFWSSFYSNVMSTVAGVAVGLPVALELNRLALREQTLSQRRADLLRLVSGFTLIVQEIGYQRTFLAVIAEGARRGTLTQVLVNTSTWRSLSRDILPNLTGDRVSQDLAGRIIAHYDRIDTLQLQISTEISEAMSGRRPMNLPPFSATALDAIAANSETVIRTGKQLTLALEEHIERARSEAVPGDR
jgi:hypothetical protein